MIKIAQVINNIKTDLAAFTWTSDSGGGTSQFNAVFTFPNYENTDGFPFVVIADTTAVPDTGFNKYVEFEHSIDIQICANYSVIDEADLPAKQEECMLRIREAWDAVRGHLVKDTTMDAYIGVNRGWTRGFSFVNGDLPDLNLFRRIARITIKEVTLRY